MKAAAVIGAVILDLALAWAFYWAVLCPAEISWHPYGATLLVFWLGRALFTFCLGVSLGQFLLGLKSSLPGIPGRLSGIGRVGAELLFIWAIPGEIALLCQQRLTWAERLAQAPLQLRATPWVALATGSGMVVAFFIFLWAPALALNPLWPQMADLRQPATAVTSSAEDTLPVAHGPLWHSVYFAFTAPAAPVVAIPSFKIVHETGVKVYPAAILMEPYLVAQLSVQGSYYWHDLIPALAGKSSAEKALFFTKAFNQLRHPRLARAWHWAAFAQAQSAIAKLLPYPVPARGQIINLGNTTFLRLHQDLRPLAMPTQQAVDVLLPLREENPTVLEIAYQSLDEAKIQAWPFKFWPPSTKWDFAPQTNLEIQAEAFPAPENFSVWQIFDFYMTSLGEQQTAQLENFIFHYFYDLGQKSLTPFAKNQVQLALGQLAAAAELLTHNSDPAKFSETYFKSLQDLQVSLFNPLDEEAATPAPRALASRMDPLLTTSRPTKTSAQNKKKISRPEKQAFPKFSAKNRQNNDKNTESKTLDKGKTPAPAKGKAQAKTKNKSKQRSKSKSKI